MHSKVKIPHSWLIGWKVKALVQKEIFITVTCSPCTFSEIVTRGSSAMNILLVLC